jgi:hypothetical protein
MDISKYMRLLEQAHRAQVSTTWTADRVRQAAELEDFDAFRGRMKKILANKFGHDGERRTGRSTKLLCEAIAEALNGGDVIYTCTYDPGHYWGVCGEIIQAARIKYTASWNKFKIGAGRIEFMTRRVFYRTEEAGHFRMRAIKHWMDD